MRLHVLREGDRPGDAGVVHQDVDGSELGLGPLDHRLHGVGVGDVGGNAEDRAAPGGELDADGGHVVRVAGVHHDGPAGCGELPGDGPADADRAAGDDDDSLP